MRLNKWQVKKYERMYRTKEQDIKGKTEPKCRTRSVLWPVEALPYVLWPVEAHPNVLWTPEAYPYVLRLVDPDEYILWPVDPHPYIHDKCSIFVCCVTSLLALFNFKQGFIIPCKVAPTRTPSASDSTQMS